MKYKANTSFWAEQITVKILGRLPQINHPTKPYRIGEKIHFPFAHYICGSYLYYWLALGNNCRLVRFWCAIWDRRYDPGQKGLNLAGLNREARPQIWNAFLGKIWGAFIWFITLFEDCCPGSQKEGPNAPASAQDQKGERPGSRSRASSESVCCPLIAPSCQAQGKWEIPTVCLSEA